MYGAMCPKPRLSSIYVDMDPFPQLGVQGGGHHEVYGDICPIHRRPYPDSNIDMDLIPHLGVQGTFVPNTGGFILI